MTIKRDYYEILGVPCDAPREYIRRAFRRLAFKYHPDRNPDHEAADRFKEITEAYEVLSDPEKRANYDHTERTRNAWYDQNFDTLGDFVGNLGQVFEAFFGTTKASERRTPRRGADLYHNLQVAFEESIFGCEKEIQIERSEHCPACRGHGYDPSDEPLTCPVCSGAGRVKRTQQSMFGNFVNVVPCDRCNGQGFVALKKCSQCQGAGKEILHKRIRVTIEPGTRDNSQIKFNGEGNAGTSGGPRGNLYVNISVSPHRLFRRNGDDIMYELPISFPQAALGGDFGVPTLDGIAVLHLPPGTQSGEVFHLENKGVPRTHNPNRGNQVVTIKVVTPRNLTKEQRKLFSKLAEILGELHDKPSG